MIYTNDLIFYIVMQKNKLKIFPLFKITIILNVTISICYALNHIKFSILEEIAVGSVIGSLQEHLSAQLMVYQNRLNFIKMKTETSDYVNISRESGKVIVNKRIDKEALCPRKMQCDFKFPVNCYNDHNFLEILEIVIEINDINDNKCYFVSLDHQTISWPENAIPHDTKEFINRPEDLDTFYSVKKSEILLSNKTDLFRLEVSQSNMITRPYILEVILIGELDYEQVKSYHLVIEAGDGALDHKCYLKLEIEVRDINDNNPIFPTNLYQTEISEGHGLYESFFKVLAQDKDSGKNAEIKYEIDNYADSDIKSQFGINSTGELYLKKILNYHENKIFKIPIIARNVNMHSRFGTCELVVTVSDINNETPEITFFSAITGTSIVTITEEELPGKDIGMVTVTDKDAGNNARVSCEIVKESLVGSMELRPTLSRNQYRLVTKLKIDREKISSISMTIQCQDSGKPVLTSEKLLVVAILDINDNAPQFPQNSITLSVNEDIDLKRKKNNYLIWRFKATDKDIDSNGEIKYSLKPLDNLPPDLIFIDPTTGVLSSNGKLDRETISSMSFIIIATDQGKDQLSSSISVNCTILDVNDNYPEFSINHGQTYYILENIKSSQFVGMFFANDLDQGINADLMFTIQTSESNFPFKIFSKKLSANERKTLKTELFNYQIEIFSTVSLDRESLPISLNNQPCYEFFIKAEDSGTPRLVRIVKIKIIVLDENDNFPYFTFPSINNSRLTLSYKQKVNYRFGKINAVDSDNGVNGTVEYKIQEGNEKNLFDLNVQTGDLSLMRALTIADVGIYTLNIVASDGGEPKKAVSQTLVIEIDNSSPLGGHMTLESLFYSEQALNLYIIVAIIVASFIISVVMLSAICIILKKSQQQRIRTAQNSENLKDNQQERIDFTNTDLMQNNHSTGFLAISQIQGSPELIPTSFCRTQSNDQITPSSMRQFIQAYTSPLLEEQQCSNNSTDMDSGKGDSVDVCAHNRILCNFDSGTCYTINDPNNFSKLANLLSSSCRQQCYDTTNPKPTENSKVDYTELKYSTANPPKNWNMNSETYGYFKPRYLHIANHGKNTDVYVVNNDDQYNASYL